jgi:transcriptional regulator with XRE-family HTH domain
MIDEKRLYRALGKRLRELREQQAQLRGRMTQAQLADLVEMERTSITNIEKGNQKVPLHVFYRMCAALGAEPSLALPALADVQASGPSGVQEVSFAGRTYTASPKIAEALTAVLGDSGSDGGHYGQ